VKLATVGCTGARVTLDRISSAFQPASNGTALFSPAAYISAAVFGRTYPSMIGENHAIRVPESTRPDAVTAHAGAARVAPFSDRFRQGITLAGPDYMRLAARSAKECQQACNGEAACKAWTWEHAKATCGLKSGTGPSVANACCTSGVK